MDLQQHLEAFVESHPDGWGHSAWLALLETLEHDGIRTVDQNRIGRELEKARLRAVIDGLQLKGMGPKRTDAVVDRFRTLWNLRHATADDVAEIPSIHRTLAERLLDAL